MRNFRRVTPVQAFSLALISVLLYAHAAAAQDWAVPTHALARKIAKTLRPGQDVTLSLQNLSTLSAEEVALVRKAMKTELRAQGIHGNSNGEKGTEANEEKVAEIRITLAENVQGLLWVAEIQKGETREVVMQEVPRTAAPESATRVPAMQLRSQKVFEQEAPILSFALVELPGSASPRLLVLEPGLIASYVLEQGRAQSRQAMPVPVADPPQRNPRGTLILLSHQSFDIVLPGASCSGAVQENLSLHCTRFADLRYPWDERLPDIGKLSSRPVRAYSVARIEVKGKPMQVEAGVDGLARLYNPDDAKESAATFAGWGSDVAGIKSGCGSGWQILVTRPGDSTERDAVQAFEIEGKRAVAVSPALEFAGPVQALGASENKDTGFAVVRNLQTGRYEAHVLTLSCSH